MPLVVEIVTLLLGIIGSVAFFLAAALYQGNPYRKKKHTHIDIYSTCDTAEMLLSTNGRS